MLNAGIAYIELFCDHCWDYGSNKISDIKSKSETVNT